MQQDKKGKGKGALAALVILQLSFLNLPAINAHCPVGDNIKAGDGSQSISSSISFGGTEYGVNPSADIFFFSCFPSPSHSLHSYIALQGRALAADMSSNYARAGLFKSIASTFRDAGFTEVVRIARCNAQLLSGIF